MKLSNLSERLAEAMMRANEYKELALRGPAEKPPPSHVISISREPGALGTSVARGAGKLLGWPVYDRELLDRIGAEMGTHADVLKTIDEKPVSWLEEAVLNLVMQYNLSQDNYMVHLVAIVRSLAAEGNCVIVGRGANFMLPHETTLNVRLVADRKDRVANLQRLHNLSEKEAGRLEEKLNRERHDFVKRHFGKEVSDPHFYDLVLNTSRLSAEEGAEVLIAALHQLQARKPAVSPQLALA
jgi:cytidylate kinase